MELFIRQLSLTEFLLDGGFKEPKFDWFLFVINTGNNFVYTKHNYIQ